MKLIILEILKKGNAQKYLLWPNPWVCIIVFVVVIDHSRLKLRRLLSLSFGAYESYLIFDIKNRCGNTSYHKICPWEIQNKV